MRKKTEAKRQSILKVAAEIFREMGFDNTSMAEIAARVGGSKATLYNYFRSKEEIFVEVMRELAEQHHVEVHSYLDEPCPVVTVDVQNRADAMFSELQQANDDIATTLRQFGFQFISFTCSPDLLSVRRMLIGESGRTDIGRHFYERGPQRGMERITSFIASAMERGQLRAANATTAAAHLRGLLESELHERCLFRVVEQISEEEIRTAANNAITVYLAAYGVPQP